MKNKTTKLVLGITLISLMSSLFIGCKKEETVVTPEDVEPNYYTSETELPDDAYYIVKKVKKETRYYPLLKAENTCSSVNSAATGFDDSRIEWVNYSVDEGLIPTMSSTDQLIYKSSTSIPTSYSLEKFFDNGYTFGVSGLTEDTSGNSRYLADDGGAILSTSSAAGFASLSDVESVYFVSYKDSDKKDAKTVKIDESTLSDSGTVKGLKLLKSYDCDIRTGTEKVPATLVCDTHYFSSAETYRFGEFDFITEHIAKLGIPEYVSTGYYTIGSNENAGGFFRYVEGDTDYKDLSADDYNKTIYLYDEYGTIGGTTTGLVFDPDTGFLVGAGDLSDEYDSTAADTRLYSYAEYKGKKTGNYSSQKTEDPEDTITNKTTLDTVDGSTYMGTFQVTSITKDTITSNKKLYEFVATELNTSDTLTFRYFGKTSKDAVVPTVGSTYTIQFAPVSGFDGYLASYMEQVSEGDPAADASSENTENTEAVIQE